MTSLETLYCLKEFRIADIPLSGVSGVMGAVCCVMCTEVVWEMVGRSRVGCKVRDCAIIIRKGGVLK